MALPSPFPTRQLGTGGPVVPAMSFGLVSQSIHSCSCRQSLGRHNLATTRLPKPRSRSLVSFSFYAYETDLPI